MAILCILLVLLPGCQDQPQVVAVSGHADMLPPSSVSVEPTQEQKLERYIQTMTLEEKVGQLFYVTIGNLGQPGESVSPGGTGITEREIEVLQQYAPGGIILMGSNIYSDSQVQELIGTLQDSSRIPLFIGVDEEGGMVSRLGKADGISMENVGSMKAIGASQDERQAYETGKTLASGLSALGFNMDFAPVADVLTNPNNYEIGSRSFGSDAVLVANMVRNEVQGLQEHGICAVAKHFPGHGGVIGNSHNNLQYVDTSLEELRNTEFLPFQAAIQADSDVILISHLVLTDVEPEHPSTLSRSVVNGLLREELGYEGIIITDSFQMGSITENYDQAEAAVMAIQSGCDMILMPAEYESCYQGILEAVQTGSITEEQINQICIRILQTKIKRGILTMDQVEFLFCSIPQSALRTGRISNHIYGRGLRIHSHIDTLRFLIVRYE